MWIDGLKILAVVCGLAGVALNIKKERLCFVLWFVSNGCWAWLTRAEYLLSVQFAVFCVVCIYGWFAWQPKKKPARQPKRVIKPIKELVYQGNINDQDTIYELKRRLVASNGVSERLLFKLRGMKVGPTRIRGLKKQK